MENGSLFRSIRTSCCHAKFSTHTYGGLCMHMIFSHWQVRKVEIKIQPQYLIIRFFPFQQRSRKNEYQQILLTIQCELLTLIWHTSLCFSLSSPLYGIFLQFLLTRFRFSISLCLYLCVSCFFFNLFFEHIKCPSQMKREQNTDWNYNLVESDIEIWRMNMNTNVTRTITINRNQTRRQTKPRKRTKSKKNWIKKAILNLALFFDIGSIFFHMNISIQPFRFVPPFHFRK